jgi:hypothetical protein
MGNPYAPPPYRPTGPPAASPPAGSGATSALKVILAVVVGVFAFLVVSIAAVTFLGKAPESERFEEVDGAIAADDPAAVPWVPYSPADGSFTIEFPEKPAVERDQGEIENIVGGENAIADLGDSGYAAMYFEFAPDLVIDDPTFMLDSTVDGMAEGMGGIAFSTRTPSTFGFLPSLELVGTFADGSGTFQGVAFVSERRVFVLFVLAEAGVPVEYDRFVASFKTG